MPDRIHKEGAIPTSVPPPSRPWRDEDGYDMGTRTKIARERKEKEAERKERAGIDFNDAPTDMKSRERRE